ncbi:hypothetical protein [Sodalis sp.]|uniref:hypothetical protein n=1 Tax=Sodalis sp. (in: enterobacteria) TaxID=1898979 RepID=UPI0038739E01
MLHKLIGHTLITTDSKRCWAPTASGAGGDVTAIVRLKEQSIPYGTIRIAFTPDKEVARGHNFSNNAHSGIAKRTIADHLLSSDDARRTTISCVILTASSLKCISGS